MSNEIAAMSKNRGALNLLVRIFANCLCEETNVRIFQKLNTHKFTWFGNLPTPRSYWFVLILLRNNTNNKTRRRRKFFSTQLSL
jgi:hypothetical protein